MVQLSFVTSLSQIRVTLTVYMSVTEIIIKTYHNAFSLGTGGHLSQGSSDVDIREVDNIITGIFPTFL